MESVLKQFTGKKVAVIGAGKEGIAMARFMVAHGALVEVRDQDGNKKIFIKNQAPKEATIVAGMNYLQDLNAFDYIVRSPGIQWLKPELVAARNNNVEVTSQTEIFIKHCPCTTIGVTGTKGKSTTATLISELIRVSGKHVRLGGNIGEVFIDWLEKTSHDCCVVLELSSFQLQGLSVSPNVAVVLDVTTEHLDYHKDVYEYVEAKANIVRSQTTSDYAILNADSKSSIEYAKRTRAKVYQFSCKKEVENGVFISTAGDIVFREDGVDEIVSIVSHVKLYGKHNWSNVAAAVTCAKILKIPNDQISQVLSTFSGLPHRLQRLGTAAKREWVDDTYATAPDATIAALESLKELHPVLVVGGSSKGYGFSNLASEIVKHQPKAVIAIGQTGPEIVDLVKRECELKGVRCPSVDGTAKSTLDIIEKSIESSKPGDTILFSPGCASFGMYKNAVDRADQFVSAVHNLER